MSLYSSVSFVNIPLPNGTNRVNFSQFIVRVEEDQMDLVLNFQGNLVGATTDTAALRFFVNGVAQPALNLWATTFLANDLQRHANFSHHVSLPKGEHTVAMEATVTGAGVAIDGANFDCRFSATRVSSDATLAHGVGSKVQGIY
jgi:hypothetical protein